MWDWMNVWGREDICGENGIPVRFGGPRGSWEGVFSSCRDVLRPEGTEGVFSQSQKEGNGSPRYMGMSISALREP